MGEKKEETDLKSIILQAQSGDKNAFEKLYSTLVDKLFAYALSHTKDRETALDVTQEVFIDLWQALPRFSYRTHAEFMGFVFTITKRKVLHTYSRNTKERDLFVTLKNTEERSFTDNHEDSRHLLKTLDELSESYRDIVILRYWSDLSFKEIGCTLEIPENTAKVMHHRALKKLEDIINPHYSYGK